jgi:NRAMP (natural resistance-associated macrophage protein)-like metal ion transporter
MDPGNWATDIEAGSRYGTTLLFVVVLSSLAAIVLQTLSMRLGLVTGKDLARMSRERFGPRTVRVQWLLAELAIIACDIAEVLGSALAFKLLLHVPLWGGVLLTALDTVVVLGLKGKGFRQLEAIILGLISTIAVCFLVQLILAPPDAGAVARGLIPSLDALKQGNALYLSIGILGATIMPHNLYLHSAIVQTRVTPADEPGKRAAIRLSTIDTVVSLLLALFINAAILILAASAFHGSGLTQVAGIEEAHKLLAPGHRRRAGRRAVRHRPVRLGPELDLHRHHRRPGDPGGVPGPQDPLLAAAADHPGPGHRPGPDRRADDGRGLGRQASGADPGGAQRPAAVRHLAAAALHRRQSADGRVRQRPG